MTVTTISKAADETRAKVTVTAGAVTPAPPSAHRRAFLTWLAVYPTITAAFLVLGPHLGHLPLAARTLVMTLLVVPVVTYLVMPRLLAIESRVARREAARRNGR